MDQVMLSRIMFDYSRLAAVVTRIAVHTDLCQNTIKICDALILTTITTPTQINGQDGVGCFRVIFNVLHQTPCCSTQSRTQRYLR